MTPITERRLALIVLVVGVVLFILAAVFHKLPTRFYEAVTVLLLWIQAHLPNVSTKDILTWVQTRLFNRQEKPMLNLDPLKAAVANLSAVAVPTAVPPDTDDTAEQSQIDALTAEIDAVAAKFVPVKPPPPAATAVIGGLTITPNTIQGGSGVTGQVDLVGPIATDTTVHLDSDTSAAVVPLTVDVPAGQVSAQFPISTITGTAVVAGIAATIEGSGLVTHATLAITL